MAPAECNDGNAWSFFPVRSREILAGFSPRMVKRSYIKEKEKKTAKNDDSVSVPTNMSNNPLEDLGNLAKICPKEEEIRLGEG